MSSLPKRKRTYRIMMLTHLLTCKLSSPNNLPNKPFITLRNSTRTWISYHLFTHNKGFSDFLHSQPQEHQQQQNNRNRRYARRTLCHVPSPILEPSDENNDILQNNLSVSQPPNKNHQQYIHAEESRRPILNHFTRQESKGDMNEQQEEDDSDSDDDINDEEQLSSALNKNNGKKKEYRKSRKSIFLPPLLRQYQHFKNNSSTTPSALGDRTNMNNITIDDKKNYLNKQDNEQCQAKVALNQHKTNNNGIKQPLSEIERNAVRDYCALSPSKRPSSTQAKFLQNLTGYPLAEVAIHATNNNDTDKPKSTSLDVLTSEIKNGSNEKEDEAQLSERRQNFMMRMEPVIQHMEQEKEHEMEWILHATGCRVEKQKRKKEMKNGRRRVSFLYIDVSTGQEVDPEEYQKRYLNALQKEKQERRKMKDEFMKSTSKEMNELKPNLPTKNNEQTEDQQSNTMEGKLEHDGGNKKKTKKLTMEYAEMKTGSISNNLRKYRAEGSSFSQELERKKARNATTKPPTIPTTPSTTAKTPAKTTMIEMECSKEEPMNKVSYHGLRRTSNAFFLPPLEEVIENEDIGETLEKQKNHEDEDDTMNVLKNVSSSSRRQKSPSRISSRPSDMSLDVSVNDNGIDDIDVVVDNMKEKKNVDMSPTTTTATARKMAIHNDDDDIDNININMDWIPSRKNTSKDPEIAALQHQFWSTLDNAMEIYVHDLFEIHLLRKKQEHKQKEEKDMST